MKRLTVCLFLSCLVVCGSEAGKKDAVAKKNLTPAPQLPSQPSRSRDTQLVSGASHTARSFDRNGTECTVVQRQSIRNVSVTVSGKGEEQVAWTSEVKASDESCRSGFFSRHPAHSPPASEISVSSVAGKEGASCAAIEITEIWEDDLSCALGRSWHKTNDRFQQRLNLVFRMRDRD